MSIKHLFAAAAVAPLCFAASAALAQTAVTTATTTPLNTAAAGNIEVQSAGSITPAATETLPAITVNSNATITVTGTVLMRDQPNGTAILFQGAAGGRTFSLIENGGIIRADDSLLATDPDNDGDQDGPFVADPALRYGVRFIGPGTFTGDINQSSGIIAVEGNGGSTALSIETPLIGNIKLKGTVASLGTNSYAFRSTAPITGNIEVGGSISAIGEGATGVSIENGVTGALLFSGAIINTGFRYTERPADEKQVAKLDADDLLIGGPAVRISSSITGGVRFQVKPTDLDTTIDDEDLDGVPDADQTSANLMNYGSQPGIVIGGAGAVVLGNVGTGAKYAYGLIIQSTISSFGVYDGIGAVGVVVGGQGGTVNTTGGVLISGSVVASSAYGDGTAVRFGAGAAVPELNVSGAISAGAVGDATRIPVMRGIQIDAGANVASLINSGVIRTGVNGPSGDLTTILDASGSLTSVHNQGQITSQISTGSSETAPTGTQIAVDLRANTAGVTFVQEANPDPTVTTVPSITGDVLFGSGAANLRIDKGTIAGAVRFGVGADVLTIAQGGALVGDLTDAGGGLTATVNGNLSLTAASVIPMTSLATGTDSSLLFTADQQGAGVSQLNAATTATLGSGTTVSLGFKSKLTVSSLAPYAPQTLTLIHATGGLINNGYDTDLAGDLPFIYRGALTNDANNLYLSVQRRTADEMGLQGAKASAFEAFYATFDKDPTVALQVFGQTSATAFNDLYSQFLPDYSGGPFHSVAEAGRALARVQSEQPVDMASNEPRSWLQEIAFGVDHASTSGQVVYDTAGFGLAGGFERPGKSGTVGYAVAFATSDVDNANRAYGSSLSASSLMGSLYWRQALRGVVFDASATGGYAWFGSTRRVVGTDATGAQVLVRTANADWSGAMASTRLGASYEAKFGSFYVRPEAFVDYVYLYESGYTENGGGLAVNLTVDSRASNEASAQAGLTFGARFGRTFHWGPEFSVAYRAHLAGTFGDTDAHFTSLPGSPFTLPALAADRQRLVLRAALRGSGAYANFSLEGQAELGDLYDEYMGRMVVRFLF